MEKRLEPFEMNYLRRLMRKSWTVRRVNESVLKEIVKQIVLLNVELPGPSVTERDPREH